MTATDKRNETGTESRPVVIMRGIRKDYEAPGGKVPALRDVDLEVERQEFLAVMGRSGSGKSTLLNILGTLLKPTGGEYILDGEPVEKLKKTEILALRRRKIGFVFQQYRLLQAYTVWENICMPLALDQAVPDRIYLETLAERCGIEDKLDRYPEELSGGQQQRVALIRAMAARPAILLADEPTGNLDYRTGMAVIDLLHDCREEFHQTVIMVTHDNECASAADRILMLADGRIER